MQWESRTQCQKENSHVLRLSLLRLCIYACRIILWPWTCAKLTYQCILMRGWAWGQGNMKKSWWSQTRQWSLKLLWACYNREYTHIYCPARHYLRGKSCVPSWERERDSCHCTRSEQTNISPSDWTTRSSVTVRGIPEMTLWPPQLAAVSMTESLHTERWKTSNTDIWDRWK